MILALKILAFCLGVPFGAYLAVYLVVAGSNKTVLGRVCGIIEAPVVLVTEWVYPQATHNTPAGSTRRMGFFMVLHLCYWGLLGGLLALGMFTACERLVRAALAG